MLIQVDLTLNGIEATYEINGEQVEIVLSNAEVAKTQDIVKLANNRLAERLKVLTAADELRGLL